MADEHPTEEAPEILLIEDNPNDAELALHAFKKYLLANRIEVARDGEEALDYIFGRGRWANRGAWTLPRLVLLDIKLPKVDGLEVLRVLKSDERTRRVPVVMLTASRESRDIVEGYALGANGYVVKPMDFQEFTESIRTVGTYWLLLNRPPLAAPAGDDPARRGIDEGYLRGS